MNLTQKEYMLLQDQKKNEELCIKKYNSYASQAQDQNLKQLFLNNASQEQQHLDTINQILNGQTPSTNQQSQQSNQNTFFQDSFNQGSFQASNASQNGSDKDLCEDLLSTEKYVSSTYDTVIFEFRDPNIRQALNHIQKEEQEHGEKIFSYMQSNGMYQVQ